MQKESNLESQKENKKFSYLGFVSHSGSFNQSVQRYKHLQQLSEIRKKQAELLKQTRLKINNTINVIHLQIGEKEKIKSQSDTLKNELLDAFHNPHQTKFFLQNIWSKYDV